MQEYYCLHVFVSRAGIQELGMDLVPVGWVVFVWRGSEHRWDVGKTGRVFVLGGFFFGSQRGCGGFVRLQDPRDISLFSFSRSLIYWIGFSLLSVPSKSRHQNSRGS